MRRDKREMLARVYSILGDVPFPAGQGRQSATIAGLSVYAQDMRYLIPGIRAAILAVCVGELAVAEGLISGLEERIQTRVEADWA